MAELTDKARKLFEAPNLLFVATVNQDGSPQVTPVWTHVENGNVTFNTAKGRVKERNLRRDPRIGLSITDRENPMDKVDIAGRVIEIASGLSADDRIVIAPPDGIADGDQVRVVGGGGAKPKPATASEKQDVKG